jgi:galactokinase
MKASLVIEEIKKDKYEQLFQHIYIDQGLIGNEKERYINAIKQFIELYGDKDIEIYNVPGRSEVCGNHTDHQHGKVLAASVNLDMIAIVSKNEDIHVVSDNYNIKTIHINDLDKKEEEKATSEALIRGVLYKFKQLNYQIGGFDAYITSDVLQGSGLSSSAAFEVMIGTILSGLYNNMSINPVIIAQIGQYSENEYFGKPCGLMDQCACSVGGFVNIDFKDNNNPIVNKIDIDFSKYNYSLCIVDVHASHADLTDDYASIPAEMKQVAKVFDKEYLRDVNEDDFYNQLSFVREKVNDRAVLRSIHLFEENKRVDQAVQALNNNDFNTFKSIIKQSGDSSYKYLQNIYSATHVDLQAVSLALALSELILKDKGVCRVHGGGFAGTIQVFVENDFVEEYKQSIEKYFGKDSCHVLQIRQEGDIKMI